MEWEDLYAELKNKIRWAIGSSTGGYFNLSYRVSNQLSGHIASDLLDLFKALEEKPDLDIVAYSIHISKNGPKPLDKTIA